MRRLFVVLGVSAGLLIFGQDLRRAEELYRNTDYNASLKVLRGIKSPDPQTYALMGKDYFMMGQFKQAGDYFQKAAALAPNSSEYQHWLGRTWGRRASLMVRQVPSHFHHLK